MWSTMWIILSSMMAISSNSWMMVWIFMELNTIMMCFIMSKEMNKEKNMSQSTLIYFISQCVPSILMIIMLLSETLTPSLKVTVVTMVFLMKMGVWPLHLWYLKTISMLQVSKKAMTILMTWQKVIPAFFIFQMSNNLQASTVLVMIIMVNMLLASMSLKKEMSMKSLLGLSSLYFNSWMVVSLMSMTNFLIFLTTYSMSLMMVMKFVKFMKTKNMQSEKMFWVTSITLMNMSGMPPLLFFYAKVMVFKNLLSAGLHGLSLLMIALSCLFIYHYFWNMFVNLSMTEKKLQTTFTKHPKLVITLISTSSAFALLTMIT